jgi:hypothetical protein
MISCELLQGRGMQCSKFGLSTWIPLDIDALAYVGLRRPTLHGRKYLRAERDCIQLPSLDEDR